MTDCNLPGVIPSVENPCALLPQMRAALYQLLSGQARAQVRNGDQWLTWHQGNAKALQHEVRRLEIICGGAGGRAVRVGPYAPSNALRRYCY